MYNICRLQGIRILLIYRLHELPYYQRHTLYPLDLFLGPHQLPLKTPAILLGLNFLTKACDDYSPLLIFDVLLLQIYVSTDELGGRQKLDKLLSLLEMSLKLL